MRTKLQTLTALALIIQVMVNGQTQDNQVSSGKEINVTSKRILPVLGSSTSQNKQTQASAANITIDQHKQNLTTSGSISAYNKSLTIKGSDKDVAQLLAQAEEMMGIEKDLRNKANTKSSQEKIKLIASANELSKQIELVLIQASEIKGKINFETYQFNKEVYTDLMKDPNVNDNFVDYSQELTIDAEKNIKLAKEMRQEAYAMPTAASKLGSLLNAEEKETIALDKQKQAIQNLSKLSSPVIASK